MADWYCGSTKWTAVTAWAAGTGYSVGDLRRQLASPTVGQERVFRCTTAGTSGGAEPAPWTLTKGGTTNDNTAVWTEVTGNSTYGWTAAHARINNALAWCAAGDNVWVSNNHAETVAAAQAITSLGTAASPCNIVCVDDTSGTPPTTLATTATSTTTGNFSHTFAGFAFCYGITFSSATGGGPAAYGWFNSATQWWWRLVNCTIKCGATGNDSRFGNIGNVTSDDQLLELINSNIQPGTGTSIIISCRFRWWGGTLSTTAPTLLFNPSTNIGVADIRGVDLSVMGSGKSLVNGAGPAGSIFNFENCKLGASVGITTGTYLGQGGPVVRLTNCDSGNTNYRYHYVDYTGTITHESTIILTGGASDGTQAISRKMVTSANAKTTCPLISDWIPFWVDGTSQVTATIEVLTNNVTLTDKEAWIEIEYLGTASFPQSVFVDDRCSITNMLLGTGTAQASSSASWASAPGTPVTQKLSQVFTPASKGVARARVYLAKASETMYFNPEVNDLGFTSGRQYQAGESYINEGAASSGGGLLVHPGMSGGMRG